MKIVLSTFGENLLHSLITLVFTLFFMNSRILTIPIITDKPKLSVSSSAPNWLYDFDWCTICDKKMDEWIRSFISVHKITGKQRSKKSPEFTEMLVSISLLLENNTIISVRLFSDRLGCFRLGFSLWNHSVCVNMSIV